MTPGLKPLIAGNWKMNGVQASMAELEAVIAAADAVTADVDLLIAPPATLVVAFAARARGSAIAIGGQDCHAATSGAHTGDIAAEMLADAGASAVIVGHSERRADHGETDALVRAKAEAAHRAGLSAIVCVGETAAERRAGHAATIVGGQLGGSLPLHADPRRLIVAYEPVWAIGSGLTPTVDEVAEMHGLVRALLRDRYQAAGEMIRILYGGSVKPENAGELLAPRDVDGALVGGASLKAASFLAIARAAAAVAAA